MFSCGVMNWIFISRSLIKLMGLEFLRDFESVEDVNLDVWSRSGFCSQCVNKLP